MKCVAGSGFLENHGGRHAIFVLPRGWKKEVKKNNKKNYYISPMSKDGEINWKELRLTSKAWSNFVQNYFKSVHPLYAIGHFNYLHDVKCPTPPSLIDNTAS